MPKLVRFSELSRCSQEQAIKEYIDGYNEGRNKRDHLSLADGFSCLMIDLNDDYLYDQQGILKVIEGELLDV